MKLLVSLALFIFLNISWQLYLNTPLNKLCIIYPIPCEDNYKVQKEWNHYKHLSERFPYEYH